MGLGLVLEEWRKSIPYSEVLAALALDKGGKDFVRIRRERAFVDPWLEDIGDAVEDCFGMDGDAEGGDDFQPDAAVCADDGAKHALRVCSTGVSGLGA